MKSDNQTLFNKMSDKISDVWKKSFTSLLFIHRDGKTSEESVILNKIRKIPVKKSVFAPLKNAFSKSVDKSFIIQNLLNFCNYLLSLSLKCYGGFLASFIIVSVLLGFLNDTISETTLINAVILSLPIIPTLFVSKSISAAICESKFLYFIFINLLDCKKLLSYSNSKNQPRGNISGSIIFGFITGFLSLVFTPFQIISFILFVTFTVVFLCRPETALYVLALTFTFVDIELLAYFSTIATVSYFIKALRGKRSFHIHFYDVYPLIFVLLAFFIGNKSDNELSVFAFPLLYFPFSGLVKTEENFYRIFKNILISISLFVAFEVCSTLYEIIDISLFDFRVSINLDRGIITGFKDSTSFALLYAFAFVALVCMLFFGKENKKFSFVGALLNLVALYFSNSYISIFACFVGLILAFILFSKNKIGVLAVSSALLLVFFEIVFPFSKGIDSLINVLKSTFEYRRFLFWGVNDSNMVVETYVSNGAESLWLQISLWGGVIAFLFVLISLFVFFRNGITAGTLKINSNVKIVATSIGCFMLVFGIASIGVFSWDNYRIFWLFWIIGGLSSAVRKYCHEARTITQMLDSY